MLVNDSMSVLHATPRRRQESPTQDALSNGKGCDEFIASFCTYRRHWKVGYRGPGASFLDRFAEEVGDTRKETVVQAAVVLNLRQEQGRTCDEGPREL